MDITINNIDGDTLGANTDGFDIGSSTEITITGANVYNQDDCVAVNSGTVSFLLYQSINQSINQSTNSPTRTS